jgi:Transcription antiterminator
MDGQSWANRIEEVTAMAESRRHTDNWYVFWVKMGYEEEAADEIIAAFNNEVTYQQLLIETFFRKRGKVKKETYTAFPGYIIMASEIENNDFLLRSRESIKNAKYTLKLLRYGESNQAVMREEERTAIESLWQGASSMETSTGFIEGDHIIITEGPFVGSESIIKSINRHKMQAVIEIEFARGLRRLTIGLEVVEKLPNIVDNVL